MDMDRYTILTNGRQTVSFRCQDILTVGVNISQEFSYRLREDPATDYTLRTERKEDEAFSTYLEDLVRMVHEISDFIFGGENKPSYMCVNLDTREITYGGGNLD